MFDRRSLIKGIGKAICAGVAVPFIPSLLSASTVPHVFYPTGQTFIVNNGSSVLYVVGKEAVYTGGGHLSATGIPVPPQSCLGIDTVNPLHLSHSDYRILEY